MNFSRQLIRWTISTVLLSSSALFAAPLASASSANTSNYPAAAQGQTRVMISLPPAQREDDLRVELIVGKTMWVGCTSNPAFSGDLIKKMMAGLSVPYYEIEHLTGRSSTAAGCPPKPLTEAFVPVQGVGYFVKYNSSQALAVYVPDMFEVRYRLWRASQVIHTVTPGNAAGPGPIPFSAH